MTSQWRHHPLDFLWHINTKRPRVYLSNIPIFNLIKHKIAEIQSREVNRKLWRKNGYYGTVTLTFDPRSPISIGSAHIGSDPSQCGKQPFSENCVQIDASVWMKFCSQEVPDTQTLRHTDTQTDKLEWKYNPSTISWRCNE